MVVTHLRMPSQEPLKAPSLTTAKEQLRAQPTDEQLKQQIRELDLELRSQFFRRLDLNSGGAWLLIVGLVAFFVTAHRVAAQHRRLPQPQPLGEVRDDLWRRTRVARGSVAVVGALVGAGLLAVALTIRTHVPGAKGDLAPLAATGAAASSGNSGPAWEEIVQNWPRFRGPRGDGVAACTNPPTAWSGNTGEGVAWKTAIPSPGHNSPVVWGDRVFLTGGDATKREVLCFDANKGDLLWQHAVPPPAGGFARKPEVPEGTGFAASTAATDGTRLFAIFATGELAAFDFGGKVVWSKALGVPENPYGHAASLLVWQGKLIVPFDQGEAEAGKSRVYALDPATGRVLWEQRRNVPSSWTTPIVAEVTGATQLITAAEPWVIAYDLAGGRELWRAQCLGSDLAPSPIFAAGLVVACSPGKHVVALRPDGQGDVSKTHLAWKETDLTPDITSPASNGELLFLLTTEGTLGCFDVASGAKQWEKMLDLDFHASPTLVGDRLYLFGTKGLGLVLAVDRTFREIARADLAEEIHASPAIVRDRIYVRGTKNLYCLGAPAAPRQP
jgi:outer membrane protein assembly factor BamB